MIKSFEGIRGLAALIVALYHLKIGASHFTLIRNGYLLVDLFFVMSGFVMCASYADKLCNGEDLRDFFIRRIGRLFPLLVFSTAVFVAGSDAIVFAKHFASAHGYAHALNNPDAMDYMVPSLGEILSTLSMTQGMGVFDRLILNTPSWSISVEFYTYLVFSAVCLKLRGRLRSMTFLGLSLVSLGICAWGSVAVHHCLDEKGCMSLTYDFGFARSMFSFFLGALMYRSRFMISHMPDLAQAMAMSLLALIFLHIDRFPVIAFVSPLVFMLLLVSLREDKGAIATLLKSRFCQMLGTRSYSIYLMHMPLMLVFENVAKRVNGAIPSALTMIVFVTVLFWISGWTYRYIEHPARMWINRMIERRRPEPTFADNAAADMIVR